MSRLFYGWQADVPALQPVYPGIRTPADLYDALRNVWCADTCAPRMRARWTPENPTYGQCSVTAFLAQDIFGGQVYGVPLGDGNFHCFNAAGGCAFDLTSEQFGSEALDYENVTEQFRDVHFAREEKRLRYELLKERLSESLRRLLLVVDVACGEPLAVRGDTRDVVMIPFGGTASGPYFTGRIAGPGVDTQNIGRDGRTRLSARYMLEGEDAEGRPCRIFVENQGSSETGFRPTVATDSPLLAEWERIPLEAYVNGIPGGVQVRILRHD